MGPAPRARLLPPRLAIPELASDSLLDALSRYTDPVICSEAGGQFGKTDRGEVGITDFFRTHKCNALCNALNLTAVTNGEADVPEGASRRTATSAIEIIRSKHLCQRKRQREIETREMHEKAREDAKNKMNEKDS